MSTREIATSYGVFLVLHTKNSSQLRISYGDPLLVFNMVKGASIDLPERTIVQDSSLTIVPQSKVVHREYGSSVSTELAFAFNQDCIEACALNYQLIADDLANSFKVFRSLPKTVWLSQLLDRLQFEVLICRRIESKALQFLCTEILKEIYYLIHNKKRLFAQVTIDVECHSIVSKACEFFLLSHQKTVSIDELAQHLKVSISTITRHFKNQLGMTPAQFQREKRLERAYCLLSTGNYAVADVSDLVGYEEFSSFSVAFRKKYNVKPSDVQRFSYRKAGVSSDAAIEKIEL